MAKQCDDCEPDRPLSTGSASANGVPDDDQIPGFYIPDPESRSGIRLYWVKRERPGDQRRRLGFRS